MHFTYLKEMNLLYRFNLLWNEVLTLVLWYYEVHTSGIDIHDYNNIK